jgi:site-specific DNA recombinase
MIARDAHPAIVSEELFAKANTTNRPRFAVGSAQIVKSEYLLSGLMKCSNCGFNFSGQRYIKERIHYFQDSGYINKGRSVCSSYLIRKEKIEEFVIRNIKENIFDAHCEPKLRQVIENKLQKKLADKEPAIERIETSISETEGQIRNLVDAIAKGINVDTVIPRMQQLEAERGRLRMRLQELGSFESKREAITQLARTILTELRNFEQVFDQGTTFEKKNWIRRFVRQITVDRNKNQVVCQIMKIPTVSHSVMTSLIPSESSIIGVAGTQTIFKSQRIESLSSLSSKAREILSKSFPSNQNH